VGRVDRLRAGDPGQIGPFRLLSRLGEGGMGRVYLGESPGGRKVAIKVVHPDYADDLDFRRRFAREVAAARQVGGFHTAAVVGADPDADPPWMATAYIPGPSLAQAVAEGGPLDEAGVRRLGAALVEGLAAIHECGLIHRDLKPGNVILADDGPRIIDFGIAKGADATALTGSSAVIGTLRYMSPEQLNGHELTPQSDVFALGAVLAYAATGHDPFQASTIQAVITRILTGPPDLDPLAGELRGIIGDCLAKDAGDRPSPGDLLARFSHFQAHRPTVAAAPAPAPAPGPVPEAAPSPEPRSAGTGGPAHAVMPELAPESTVNVSPGVTAGRTDPSAAQAPAAPGRNPARRASPRRPGLVMVGAVAVAGLTAGGIFMLVNHPSSRLSPASTPPATSTATGAPAATSSATGNRTASTLTATAKLTATFTDPAGKGVNSVAFGPDGTLATGDQNGSTYLWNTTGNITVTLTDPASAGVCSVAFGPDGTLATGDINGSTYLWNTATGKTTATLTGSPGLPVCSVAFGPDGTLATGYRGGSTYLWNTTTGKITATLTDPGHGTACSVAFGPDGTLATGGFNDGGFHDGSTYLWNTATGKITATLTDPASKGVCSVAFGPDGTLAAGDGNGSTYLWNTATGKITATLTDPASGDFHSGTSLAVAFGPDGTLAAGDGFRSPNLWNTTTGKITAAISDPASGDVHSVAFGPDGTLAVGTFYGTYLWHITYS
jgi:serine/threonine protein kinase/WD40 repeat protein